MPNWVTQKLIVNAVPAGPLDLNTYTEERAFIANHMTDGEFDFNKIIPLPADLQIESSVYNKPCLRLYVSRMIANGFDSPEETDQFMKQLQVVAHYFSQSPASLLISPADEESFIEQNELNDDIALHIEFGERCFKNIVKYGYMCSINFTTEMWGTKWNASETWTHDNEVIYQTPDRPAIEAIGTLAEQYPEFTFILYYIGEDVERCDCGKYIWQHGRRLGQEIYRAGSNEAYEVAFDLGVECREDYDFDSRGYHRRELDF